jgi:hypothetical protein
MQSIAIEFERQNRMSWKGAQVVYSDRLDWGSLLQRKMEQCSVEGPLAKAFFTALLLARSTQRAEAAVLEAIRRLDPDERFDEALVRGAIHASLTANAQAQLLSPQELEAAFAAVPLELRGVLGLPPDLRRCFVLRILLQLPAEACAQMLDLKAEQIDEYTCEALWSLPAYQVHASHPAGRSVLLKKERCAMAHAE